MFGSRNSPRHARACRGHPHLALAVKERKSWMPATQARSRASFDALCAGMTLIGFYLICAFVLADPVQAQSVDEFYKGKTINLVIGYSVGGGYDLYGRLVSRHIGKHIPGRPAIVPQNMTGAGSLRAAQYIYSVAPKDGTVFGTFGRTIAT